MFGKDVASAGAFHDHHQDIPAFCACGREMVLGLDRRIDKDGINVRDGAHLFGTESEGRQRRRLRRRRERGGDGHGQVRGRQQRSTSMGRGRGDGVDRPLRKFTMQRGRRKFAYSRSIGLRGWSGGEVSGGCGGRVSGG